MNNIKKLKNLMGITSKELSERTGIPYNTLKNYEYNRREPSGSALVILEKFFNKTGEYILGISDDIYSSNINNEITNSIDENLDMLFYDIQLSLKNNDPDTQKFVFNIMIEIKSILISTSMSNTQKTKCIELIHDLINGLALSYDRAVISQNNNFNIERNDSFKQKRINEYSEYLDKFFNNFQK